MSSSSDGLLAPLARVRQLNDRPVAAIRTCVLYVMGRDQRLDDNHALAAAQQQAQTLGVPLAVVFCLLPASGVRAREHYQFMLAGLREVEAGLAALDIPFMLLIGPARDRLQAVLHHLRPQAVYFDFSPLRGPLTLHRAIAGGADCAVFEVDTHNVVPVWVASDHAEVGARTLRPKIRRLLSDCLAPATRLQRQVTAWPGPVKPLAGLQPMIDELLDKVPANGTDISRFSAGEAAARQALDDFVGNRLAGYAEGRNDPTADQQSGLSPYLHFGQLSAAAVVRSVLQAAGGQPSLQADADALIEELVVRKELSDNYCFYHADYDQLSAAPAWAQRSLAKHAGDRREFVYTLEQLTAAQTHDPAWNAAQLQLVATGKMHGYMRMYWAKKVLEWSPDAAAALQSLLYLNDFYHLDGGDPNGYTGIMWSVAGVHDRPWGERPVYGVVRSMVYSGLKRKFDVKAYEDRWLKMIAG